MHRTALIALIALTTVLAVLTPAAAEGSPARVASPMTFDGMEGDAESGTFLLEEGSTSIAASVREGSIDVWTMRVPCVDRNPDTCFPGQASTQRHAIDATGGTVSITPRSQAADHVMGLLAGQGSTLTYTATEATLDLRPQEETVELTSEDDAPQGMRQVRLDRGAQLHLAKGTNLSIEGPFQFNSYDAVITVQTNGSQPERVKTGWTWEQNDGSMQWYHTLNLVRAKLDGAIVAPFDGTVRLASELPMAIRADTATVRVDEGQLGAATADTGNTTLEDAELSVTGITWNDRRSTETSDQADEWPGPIDEATTAVTRSSTAEQPSRSQREPAGWFMVQMGADPAAPPEPQRQDDVSTTTVVGASAAALAAAGLAAYYWPRLSWLGTVVFLPMYSRIEKDEILENEVRETLYELVQDDPGIHAHALSEEADVGWGTTVYHLRRLERNGFVTSEKKGRYRRFFPAAGFLARQREVLSVLQNETTNDIARVILKEPGLNQKAICEELDISPSLANWHINRLMDADLVERERRGRTVHYTPGPAWQDIKDAIDLDVEGAVPDDAVTA